MTNHPTAAELALAEWQQLNQQLKALVLKEAEARRKAFDMFFPAPTEGTNTFDLGHGYELKAVHKYNYNLANGDGQTDDALRGIEAMGPEGKLIAERLVGWTPKLSLTEYRRLDPKEPLQRDILNTLKGVLTITPGMPTLEIKQKAK